jgi:hypothetical protein
LSRGRRNTARPGSPGRGAPGLQPAPRVLIVGEGKRTEPHYLTAIRRQWDLRSVSAIPSDRGSGPESVVACAIAKKEWAQRRKRPYSRVWCVFDRDEHVRVAEAFALAARHEIELACSNPCIELWFLLHFRPWTAPLARDQAESELKRSHMTGYSKSMDKERWDSVYRGLLASREEQACRHADRLRRYHQQTAASADETSWNPYSSLDRLVCYLRELVEAQQFP